MHTLPNESRSRAKISVRVHSRDAPGGGRKFRSTDQMGATPFGRFGPQKADLARGSTRKISNPIGDFVYPAHVAMYTLFSPNHDWLNSPTTEISCTTII
jgi:hypothetical protein